MKWIIAYQAGYNGNKKYKIINIDQIFYLTKSYNENKFYVETASVINTHDGGWYINESLINDLNFVYINNSKEKTESWINTSKIIDILINDDKVYKYTLRFSAHVRFTIDDLNKIMSSEEADLIESQFVLDRLTENK